MKSLIFFIASILFFAANSISQNVGVNTTTPQAALDVNGDIILRPADIVVADGITLALDVNTVRFSNYRVTGPTADFALAGITAGIDGRMLTLFNRSGFTMQLNNEDATAAPADMIVTGTNANIIIINKGIVNLQYDATEQKWIVKSSSKGAVSGGGGFWDVSGNNIFNTNTGNVGIGINTPLARLHIKKDLEALRIQGTSPFIAFHTNAGIQKSFIQSNNNDLDLGTNDGNGILKMYTASTPKMTILPNGNVGIGIVAPDEKLTVQTLNNSYGISHRGEGGNFLSTRIGGTSAGIGTFSTTNMRIFCNGVSAIFVAAANGNVGIGTDNPTYKLSVLGNIRSTEVVVETGWADYVFDKKYKLNPLNEVEKFIKQNKHLPNIPSAKEIETNGLHLGDTQKRMMEKIEELTLYIIQQQKEIDELKRLAQQRN